MKGTSDCTDSTFPQLSNTTQLSNPYLIHNSPSTINHNPIIITLHIEIDKLKCHNIMSNDNTCANCSKGGEENSGDLKACTACKLVKYCNRDCQIHIVHNIKNLLAENEQQSCMMNLYLNSLHRGKSAQSVCCHCHFMTLVQV